MPGSGEESERETISLDVLSSNFRMGGQKFLPIVTRDDFLVCGLDILLLRRDFSSVINSGDLDNRSENINRMLSEFPRSRRVLRWAGKPIVLRYGE